MSWFSAEAERAKSEYVRILRRNIDNMANIVNANAKIHVLADETLGGIKREYVEVDRKAEVGEKIVIVNADVQCEEPYDNGNIFEVRKSLKLSNAISTVCGRVIAHGEYRVLVPVESAEDEPQPADPIDVIASLAQEVASLKRTVDRHRDEIDTLYKDKRTLGEELARLAAEVGKETESSAKAMAEAFVALRRAGL